MGRRVVVCKMMVGVLLLFMLAIQPIRGAMRRVRITDNLDDVVDNEEDEAWKAWGAPKPKTRPVFDPPPDFVDGMDVSKYRDEIVKRTMGPSMGFVKLRIDVQREPEEAPRIAKRWTGLLKSGTIDVKIVAVDRNTIMFTIPDGEDILEVKDFVLTQPDAYEFKLGQNTYRRPGDPPLEVVVEKLRKERAKSSKQAKNDVKEEL